MKTTFRLGLLAVLVALTLMGVGGISLAAGDLFDDGYSDCPHNTRFRDGQISDLSVNRDSDEQDEVNISWTATDPTTWGLGPNAFRTNLVVILDDGGDLETEILALGKRDVTFDEVDTGTEVTVQMAVVTYTADGNYLISDILEKSIYQSLSKPAFSTDIRHVSTKQTLSVTAKPAVTDNPDTTADETAGAITALTGIVREDDKVGTFYYVGYNENFGNYFANDSDLHTNPSTQRLRIGLRHGGETPGQRDDVEFKAYVLRVTDEDGDPIPEIDDVRTRKSDYGSVKINLPEDVDESRQTKHVLPKVFVLGTAAQPAPGSSLPTMVNVRVNDDGDIDLPMRAGSIVTRSIEVDPTTEAKYLTSLTIEALATATAHRETVSNELYAVAPDHHRDIPLDVLSSDGTYILEAWAINEDNEVISPVASLKVHTSNTRRSAIIEIDDYLVEDDGTNIISNNLGDVSTTSTDESVYTTLFTVLK